VIRIQIQFTEEQIQTLRQCAAQEQVSVSSLVREAVELWWQARGGSSHEERLRRARDVVGRFASGSSNGSARHDDYLLELYRG
jgi:Arc/MetJ-type ribon-helix-helix transcriptional regulator